MKHNWEYKPFKQLSNILYGCPFESEFFNSESKGMPLIRIRDVKPGYTSTYFNGGYSDDYIIKKGDYLIGMDGEFNIAPWQSEDALLNQRVCRVKSINENVILSNFIYYFLGKELKDIEAQTSFVTVKHLSAKVLNAINTPVPPMEVQERIVAELDKINETIEDCRELLRNLYALAQSLFYDYFGDPITNPKGWTLKQIKSFLSLKAGKAIKASELLCHISDGYYPCYGGNGIRGYISRKSHHGLYNIIGRQGALCGNVTLANSDFYATEHAVVVTPLIATSPYWLYYLLTALNLNQYAKGVAQPGLSVGVINEISIPVPPLELQEKFAARIEQIEAQKKAVEETIENLQTLLDSRMDYWFN